MESLQINFEILEKGCEKQRSVDWKILQTNRWRKWWKCGRVLREIIKGGEVAKVEICIGQGGEYFGQVRTKIKICCEKSSKQNMFWYFLEKSP